MLQHANLIAKSHSNEWKQQQHPGSLGSEAKRGPKRALSSTGEQRPKILVVTARTKSALLQRIMAVNLHSDHYIKQVTPWRSKSIKTQTNDLDHTANHTKRSICPQDSSGVPALLSAERFPNCYHKQFGHWKSHAHQDRRGSYPLIISFKQLVVQARDKSKPLLWPVQKHKFATASILEVQRECGSMPFVFA